MRNDDEELSEELRLAIADWFSPEELILLLNIPIDELVDIFEPEILERIEQIKEEIQWDMIDDEDDDDYADYD